MNTVVIEHVALNELPAEWRAKLHVSKNARVTIRIEEEESEPSVQTPLAENPLFGMWQDREEIAVVADFARELRSPRYNADGSRREE